MTDFYSLLEESNSDRGIYHAPTSGTLAGTAHAGRTVSTDAVTSREAPVVHLRGIDALVGHEQQVCRALHAYAHDDFTTARQRVHAALFLCQALDRPTLLSKLAEKKFRGVSLVEAAIIKRDDIVVEKLASAVSLSFYLGFAIQHRHLKAVQLGLQAKMSVLGKVWTLCDRPDPSYFLTMAGDQGPIFDLLVASMTEKQVGSLALSGLGNMGLQSCLQSCHSGSYSCSHNAWAASVLRAKWPEPLHVSEDPTDMGPSA